MKWGRENPYLFLEDWRRKSAEIEFVESDTGCLGEFQLREKWGRQWTVTKSRGKNWKSFKNCLWNAKHAFLATETSRQGKPPKHSKSKLWKKFQVFFATGRSTYKGVVSWAVKISVYPSQLDLSLMNKSPKLTRELAAITCDLDNPRLSRQNRATLFLKFFSFRKNKVLSKNT